MYENALIKKIFPSIYESHLGTWHLLEPHFSHLRWFGKGILQQGVLQGVPHLQSQFLSPRILSIVCYRHLYCQSGSLQGPTVMLPLQLLETQGFDFKGAPGSLIWVTPLLGALKSELCLLCHSASVRYPGRAESHTEWSYRCAHVIRRLGSHNAVRFPESAHSLCSYSWAKSFTPSLPQFPDILLLNKNGFARSPATSAAWRALKSWLLFKPRTKKATYIRAVKVKNE